MEPSEAMRRDEAPAGDSGEARPYGKVEAGSNDLVRDRRFISLICWIAQANMPIEHQETIADLINYALGAEKS